MKWLYRLAFWRKRPAIAFCRIRGLVCRGDLASQRWAECLDRDTQALGKLPCRFDVEWAPAVQVVAHVALRPNPVISRKVFLFLAPICSVFFKKRKQSGRVLFLPRLQ